MEFSSDDPATRLCLRHCHDGCKVERPQQGAKMPPKKIKLHVSANNASNGVLNVKVTPWRMHVGR